LPTYPVLAGDLYILLAVAELDGMRLAVVFYLYYELYLF
jgi:hypothetical protein